VKAYFKDKVVWITGASSGIGEELAKQLAEVGAKVVLSSRNYEQLEKIREYLMYSERHLSLVLDLEDTSDFDEKVKNVLMKFGRIDFLFNNGGVSQRSTVTDTSMAVHRKIMEINFFGNIALTKAVLPVMQNQKSGHIVVISSIAGKFGFYLRSAYSASKHALFGFYESLLLEESENGIDITLVCPGKIRTNISMNALSGAGEIHGKLDENQAKGMPVEACVNTLLKGVSKRKKEMLIGRSELIAVWIKRFLPSLFWILIRRQRPT
jgi:dehydrogenase/reductase SDR family protein 7B